MSSRSLLHLFTFCALLTPALANPPAWWFNGSPPIITGGTANNQAAANIGQAKWVVFEALRALDTAAPTIATQIRTDLAGTAPNFTNRIIDLTIPNPKPAGWADQQKVPLLIGQLKAISAPFYTRLHVYDSNWLATERATNGTNTPGSIFPWTTETTDDANKAIANIGQLKAVFSLRFETLTAATVDTDGDGLSDEWEIANGFNPNDPSDANVDPDVDGITNATENTKGLNPMAKDNPKLLLQVTVE